MCATTSSDFSTNCSPKTTSPFSSGTTTATGPSRAGTRCLSTSSRGVYVEFIRNLYSILAELRKKHPKVEIESCSGGGGRVDLGILRYTDEVWPSDNTDPFDRLSMQDGFTHAYTPQIMMAWVTDSPHWAQLPLDLAHLSHAQFDARLAGHWRQSESLECRRFCNCQTPDRSLPFRPANDRARRPLPADQPSQPKRIFRNRNVSGDKNQAVVFAFTHSTQQGRNFPLLATAGPRSRKRNTS